MIPTYYSHGDMEMGFAKVPLTVLTPERKCQLIRTR